MNWRVKASIQNTVAKLPPSLANPAYYWLQRRLGLMRRIDPTKRMTGAIEFCEMLERTGSSPLDARFLEVGTGWRVNVPLALWMCGARAVTTVDLNRYLKPELVRLDVRYVREHRAQIEKLVGSRLHDDRIDKLIEFDESPWDIDELFRFCRFEYVAPGDATRLPMDAGSLDVEVSYAVLEHIPPATLHAMQSEAHRVLRPGGKVLHRIDLSDHFCRADPSISPLNFLQFDERSWNAVAGNRYVYMNRLRIDDYVRIFEEAGLRVVLCDRFENPRGLEQLRSPGFRVDESFRGKSESDLATTSAWIVAEKPS